MWPIPLARFKPEKNASSDCLKLLVVLLVPLRPPRPLRLTRWLYRARVAQRQHEPQSGDRRGAGENRADTVVLIQPTAAIAADERAEKLKRAVHADRHTLALRRRRLRHQRRQRGFEKIKRHEKCQQPGTDRKQCVMRKTQTAE